jgi:putative DNA primase/helicase
MSIPSRSSASSMLEYALEYARHNMPVFPCNPDKSPATKNGFYDATTDENEIRAWWSQRPHTPIGLRTGEANGVFVLDVDGEEGRDTLSVLETENEALPATYTVSTRGGGEHRYFKHPGFKIKSTNGVIGPKLDVRGDGGYVIAPPSPGYTASRGSPDTVAHAPGWLIELVRDDREANAEPLGDTIPERQRNTSLTSLAGSMRLRNASTASILAALNEENQQKCHPPLSWREIVNIARSVGRYAPGSLPTTDLGNAERLAGRHGHDLVHVYGLGWHVWTGLIWERDETGQVERRAKETVRSIYEEAAQTADDEKRKTLATWAKQSESASRLGAMISLARSEPGIPLKADQLDSEPWLLNVQNGTLDLRTGDLRPHERDDLITKLAPMEYDTDAAAPTWEKVLEQVLPNQAVREFVQRYAGYSLTGDVSEQILLFLYGTGANGKSTLINALLEVMGDYAKQAAPELLTLKHGAHPTELADLKGARFVASIEVEEGKRLAESLVKQMTGGDRIKARFMRQDYFEFDPTHKIWLAANHRPVVRGTDHAIWRRIKLVPFEVTIPEPEQDPKLPEKLRAELPGILAWVVRGCLEWQREGLGEPEEVRSATESYRADMDPIGEFLEEMCILNENAWTAASELRRGYLGWAKDAGENPLDWHAVTDRLKERGCREKRRHVGRGWQGIELLQPIIEDITKEDDSAESYDRMVDERMSKLKRCTGK